MDPVISYRWFRIAESQGGREADAVIHNDIALARAPLSVDQQKQSEDAAAEWMRAYPHPNLFVFDSGNGSALFPAAEVYSTELAQAESSKGADVH